jgi:hypothetical protein
MVKRPRRRQARQLQSKQVGEIAGALAAAQAEMSNVPMNAKNGFLNTKFADLAAVRDACMGALNQHDIAVTQQFQPAAGQGFQTTKERKQREYTVNIQILGLLRTQFTHKSGQWMASELLLPANWGDPHNVAATITYFRRYTLAAMVGLAQFDDDGESAKQRTEARVEARKPDAAPPPPARSARRPAPPPEGVTPLSPPPPPPPAPKPEGPKRPVTGAELHQYAIANSIDPYLRGWIVGMFAPRGYPIDVEKWTEAQVEKCWPDIRDHLQKCKAQAMASGNGNAAAAASAVVPSMNGVH